MKIIRITLLLVILAGCWSFSQAATASSVAKPATIDLRAEAWHQLKLAAIVNISPRAFSLLTGHKMNLTERVAFNIAKLSMRKAMKKNPDIRAGEFFATQKKMKTWLLVLLIVLGAFFLAFLIFAAAYGGAFN